MQSFKNFLKESSIENPFKIGSNLNVYAGPSIIIKSLMDDQGISYVLLKTLDETKEFKATILQRDVEAEQTIGLTSYPSYDLAEKKFSELINTVSKYSELN